MIGNSLGYNGAQVADDLGACSSQAPDGDQCMRCLKVGLLRRHAFFLCLAGVGLLSSHVRSEAHADQSAPSSQPQSAPTETAAAAETVAATATETVFRAAVSRAYMNCLRDVDENAAEMIKNPKARDSEQQYMKKFCDGRRESCIANGNDAQCKLFVEDYAQ